MMIIVKSVMGGFVDSIRDRANGLLGDLVMDGSLQGFPYYEEFLEELKTLRDPKSGEPVVVAATPIIHTYGVVQFPNTNETAAVTVRGIRLEEYVRVNRFGEDLYYNEHYGNTRLDVARGQPVFGRAPSGRVALPEEMDRYYYDTFLPSLPEEERKEYEKRYVRKKDDTFFRGPGLFEASSATDWKPQYEGEAFQGIILGRDLFLDRLPSGDYDRDKGYPLGEPVFITMLTLSRSGDVLKEPPPKVLFRYVDDSRTGIHEIDSKSVYIDFDRAQQLLQMGPVERIDGTTGSARCTQIQIKLNEKFATPEGRLLEYKELVDRVWRRVADRVEADDYERKLMFRVGFSTWQEMQASYIAAIQKEEFLVLIMFGVISLVAIFLILCIFYMIVQEKTRDVGIIKSVGGSTEGIAAVFLVYGAAIGLVGCLIGSILGTTFVTYINDVQDFLARLHPGMRIWNPETYSFDQIPSKWEMAEVLWISALAVVASVLGAAVPAIKAGKTWPVESLRYE